MITQETLHVLWYGISLIKIARNEQKLVVSGDLKSLLINFKK